MRKEWGNKSNRALLNFHGLCCMELQEGNICLCVCVRLQLTHFQTVAFRSADYLENQICNSFKNHALNVFPWKSHLDSSHCYSGAVQIFQFLENMKRGGEICSFVVQ